VIHLLHQYIKDDIYEDSWSLRDAKGEVEAVKKLYKFSVAEWMKIFKSEREKESPQKQG
jgi:hypothetical protein